MPTTDTSSRDAVSTEKERNAATPVDHPQRETSESGQGHEAEAVSRTRNVLELLALVAAPTTLLIALAYYFGWRLTESRTAYFGIDHSTLGFSTQDYLLRSTDALYVPLGVILFAGLVALAVHAYISDCLKRRRHLKTLRRVVPAAVAVGGVLFLAGAYGVFRPLPFHTHYLFTPLSVALGIVLLVYGGYVFAALLSPRSASASERWFAPGPVAIGLVSMLVVLSLFWAASAYAAALGRGRAEILETGLSERPGVIVYSKERLGLTGPGVVEEELPGARSAFHFRYEGLRLLIRSDDKYFLLPDGWTRSNGTAIVLPDSSGLRFEFTVGQ